MAYRDDPYRAGVHGITPLVVDIAALQALYGVNSQTRADNNRYLLEQHPPSNTSDLFGLSALQIFAGQRRAIWDAGGNDSFTGHSLGANDPSWRVAA